MHPLHPTDPRVIGGFQVTRKLGEGGQGVVFEGQAPDGRRVAIKLLRDLAGARRYFDRELAAVRRVAPFCTAAVLAADTTGAVPYIVSEYVDGPPLSDAGTLSGPALDRLAIATATALAAIHEAGVVHRDFKPANVLLGPDGPRVIDFGIARALDAPSSTASGAVGTPAYMAPEQIRGEPAGPPMDMFAWGCTMVFAATGRPPFGNDAVHTVMHRVLTAEPDLGALSGELRGLVATCLAKDPARRPTAHQALQHLLGGGRHPNLLADGAAATTLAFGPATTLPPRRRSRAPLIAAIAGTTAVVIAIPLGIWLAKTVGTAKATGSSSPGAAVALPSGLYRGGTLNVQMSQVFLAPLLTGLDKKGFNTDLVNAVAGRLGLTASASLSPEDALIEKMAVASSSGTPMVAIGDYPVTTYYTRQFAMVSYLTSGTGWAVKKGHAEVDVTSACGKKIAVVTGSPAAGQLSPQGEIGAFCKGIQKITIDAVPGPAQAAADVESGKAAAMAGDTPAVDWQISLSKGALVASGKPYGGTPIGIMVPHEQQKLAQVIQYALNKMIADGSYGKLLDKWGIRKEGVTTATISR